MVAPSVADKCSSSAMRALSASMCHQDRGCVARTWRRICSDRILCRLQAAAKCWTTERVWRSGGSLIDTEATEGSQGRRKARPQRGLERHHRLPKEQYRVITGRASGVRPARWDCRCLDAKKGRFIKAGTDHRRWRGRTSSRRRRKSVLPLLPSGRRIRSRKPPSLRCETSVRDFSFRWLCWAPHPSRTSNACDRLRPARSPGNCFSMTRLGQLPSGRAKTPNEH